MKRIAIVASAVALFGTMSLLLAGPLDPPAGPVSSTYKTLTEVEPRIAITSTNTPGSATATYRITQPGSYYLTGNLVGEAGKIGISVETSNVTIDLSGYAMIGPGAGSGNGSGISAFNLSNIRVTNGVLRSWPGRSVMAASTINSMYDHLRISGGGITQTIYAGSSSIITDCVLDSNGGTGISVDSNCVITRCTISNCPTAIVTPSQIASGCVISDCAISGCSGTGIDATTPQNRIERCLLTNIAGNAIATGTACEVRDNTIVGTSAAASAGAISVGTSCLVRNNFCRTTGVGIRTNGPGNTIIQNHFSGHTNVYVLTINNHVGPFVNTANTAAATGSANLASTMGSSDPNANFIE